MKVSKYLVKKAIEFELAKRAKETQTHFDSAATERLAEALVKPEPQRRKFDRFKHRLARDKQP